MSIKEKLLSVSARDNKSVAVSCDDYDLIEFKIKFTLRTSTYSEK